MLFQIKLLQSVLKDQAKNQMKLLMLKFYVTYGNEAAYLTFQEIKIKRNSQTDQTGIFCWHNDEVPPAFILSQKRER